MKSEKGKGKNEKRKEEREEGIRDRGTTTLLIEKEKL
jgi:hypothetical protein